MEYYPVERKKELLPFMTAWMEHGWMSEISLAVKEKYYTISPVRVTK